MKKTKQGLLRAHIYEGAPYIVTICGKGLEAERQLGRIHLDFELAKVEHEFYVKHEEGRSVDQDVSVLTIDFEKICSALDPRHIAFRKSAERFMKS